MIGISLKITVKLVANIFLVIFKILGMLSTYSYSSFFSLCILPQFHIFYFFLFIPWESTALLVSDVVPYALIGWLQVTILVNWFDSLFPLIVFVLCYNVILHSVWMHDLARTTFFAAAFLLYFKGLTGALQQNKRSRAGTGVFYEVVWREMIYFGKYILH